MMTTISEDGKIAVIVGMLAWLAGAASAQVTDNVTPPVIERELPVIPIAIIVVVAVGICFAAFWQLKHPGAK